MDVNGDLGANRDVSIEVVSDTPIAVERPMYFDYHGWTGGHVIAGISNPKNTWRFAYGNTAENYDEYICIQNPNGETAEVAVTYLFESRKPIQKTVTVSAMERGTIAVHNDIYRSGDVSVVLDSDLPIVAERPMYINHDNIQYGGTTTEGSEPITSAKNYQCINTITLAFTPLP